MTQYTYATEVEAQTDESRLHRDIEEGETYIKLGKHDNGYDLGVLKDADSGVGEFVTVTFATLSVFESPEPLPTQEMLEFVAEQSDHGQANATL